MEIDKMDKSFKNFCFKTHLKLSFCNIEYSWQLQFREESVGLQISPFFQLSPVHFILVKRKAKIPHFVM